MIQLTLATLIRALTVAVCALALPAAAAAQAPYAARQVTLASSFDLDGEAADDNQIVEAVDVEDDKDDYVIAAQPDVCRLVDVTVTDADSSLTAGTLTVTGTDCWGYPLIATFTFAAGGSGVESLTPTAAAKASAAYFSTVTQVATDTLTGEAAGDTIEVGYTTNSAKGWVLYGRQQTSPSGRRYVNIFGDFEVPQLVTNGAATTDVTAVSASTTAPFENVSVGDLIVFNVAGEIIPRVVASRADADTITVNAGVTIPAAGVTFRYRKRYFSTDPQDGWIPVSGWDVVTFVTDVDANANTGGVVTSVECAVFSVSDPPDAEVQAELDTATVASAATGTDITSVDLRTNPQWTHCRTAVRFGTGDDADAAAEDIDIAVGFRK